MIAKTNNPKIKKAKIWVRDSYSYFPSFNTSCDSETKTMKKISYLEKENLRLNDEIKNPIAKNLKGYYNADIWEKKNSEELYCNNPECGCGRPLYLLEENTDLQYQIWRCPAGFPDYIVRYKAKRKEKTKKELKVDLDGNINY